MADRPIRLGPILLEAGLVVLGVFVALIANEWRAEVNDRERAAQSRLGIVEEIRTNREAVREMSEYHEGLIDTLRTLAPDGPTPSFRVFSRGFASAATLSSTAWDAANATGTVSHMDFDDVLAFSELYAEQRRYERVAEEVGTIIFGEIFERGSPGVLRKHRNLTDLNASLLYVEQNLLAMYDRLLGALADADPG